MGKTQRQIDALRESNRRASEQTRENIRQALLLLMLREDYDAITLTDIIKKSGVSRSAFYRHFYTKREILIDCYRAMAADEPAGTDDIANNWRRLFGFIARNADALRLFDRAGQIGLVLEQINESAAGPDAFEQRLWNGMIFNVGVIWLRGGMRESAEDMLDQTMAALRTIGAQISRTA